MNLNFSDFKAEMKRISWPSRSMTLNATRGVLFVIFIVALFLGLIDLILSKILAPILV
ncbi:preprotein translocase subunit SecE [bacterium]|nr:preprotein translocase subunit SecE [bacterium]|tara:strand:+ start:669 stop:842 length:174 start_codon:yes stop_codon:yes gene_type:complete